MDNWLSALHHMMLYCIDEVYQNCSQLELHVMYDVPSEVMIDTHCQGGHSSDFSCDLEYDCIKRESQIYLERIMIDPRSIPPCT